MSTPCGEEASMVGDRLVWDPSGRLEPEEFVELVEELELRLWARLNRRERHRTVRGID